MWIFYSIIFKEWPFQINIDLSSLFGCMKEQKFDNYKKNYSNKWTPHQVATDLKKPRLENNTEKNPHE